MQGKRPAATAKTEFWELLNKLYEVHDAFKSVFPYYPTATEICKEIEDFILELQQKTTLPQRFSIEELTEQGRSDMAVTSLWHVKGSIKDVIDYIENPEKTVPNEDMQDFFDVFSYVKKSVKKQMRASMFPLSTV